MTMNQELYEIFSKYNNVPLNYQNNKIVLKALECLLNSPEYLTFNKQDVEILYRLFARLNREHEEALTRYFTKELIARMKARMPDPDKGIDDFREEFGIKKAPEGLENIIDSDVEKDIN